MEARRWDWRVATVLSVTFIVCFAPTARARDSSAESGCGNLTARHRHYSQDDPNIAITAAPSDFHAEIHLSTDHLPLLRYMIFTGVCLFGFVLAWHFGLVRMMLNGDRTYISVIILLISP